VTRRLLFINLLLLAISAAAIGYIASEVLSPPERPAPPRARAAVDTPPAEPGAEPQPRASAGAYAVVASRNLFSPTRTEAPPAAAQTGRQGPPQPKPMLHGVVVRDGAPIAYLEDPATKRVAGYRLGDTVAGGTVRTIAADHVTLAGPDGQIDVRLRDPSRPRPAAPQPAQPGAPGAPQPAQGETQPGITPQQSLPRVVPPRVEPQIAPGQLPQPRRPIPPNVLRRVPPSTNDANP
jgi:hypothetical protein